MAKDSKLSNIGDSLIVSVNPIVNGEVTLTGFEDEFLGLTDEKTVKREYRISTEDIFFTDWLELTNENLSTFNELIVYKFLIEVRYTRIGTDATGDIEFVKIDFQGIFKDNTLVAPTIKNSIFNSVINTPELNDIENNLFKKLYRRGIVANYIKRGDNSEKSEDLGFFVLFSTVARFFGMIIRFMTRFDNFKKDYDLMLENVNQKGLFIDESSVTLDQLNYLSENYLNEIRKRGTEMIFKHQNTVLTSGGVTEIDGELLRLFRNTKNDEMVHEVIPLENFGWCLGKSSPMYKGTSNSKYLNKTLENTEDFVDLENFIIANNLAEINLVSENDKNVLNVQVQSGGVGGLGRISDEDVSGNLTTVDPDLDYEITFMFKKNIEASGELKFSIEGFNGNQDKLSDAFTRTNSTLETGEFFSIPLSNLQNNEWYFFRGIINSYSSILALNQFTNSGFGNNLCFNNGFTKFICPKIHLTGDGTNGDIWNYKIRPLIRGKNILPLKNSVGVSTSMGFIQSYNLLYLYIKNNNNNLSNEQIEEYAERYLLPYNLKGVFVYL